MDIREMHYDFKIKFNKLDSQYNRNLLIPEIDWKLNEAQEVFVKAVAEPRYREGLGFEINQRSIDDIKTIVKKQFFDKGQCIATTKVDDYTWKASLPVDYMFKTSARVRATKGSCSNKELVAHTTQDDDLSQETHFTIPSFEWRETNILFSEEGILIKSDGSFTPTHLCLNYIATPTRMYNARDYQGGQYRLPSGILLTGFQDCILPAHLHSEIVDIAVLLATSDQLSEYQVKQAKTRITD